MNKSKELVPLYDTAKSFYKKAHVFLTDKGLELMSYETIVATIQDEKATVYNTYSPTTLRHIKEFLKQNNFKAETKKQILEDYKEGIKK